MTLGGLKDDILNRLRLRYQVTQGRMNNSEVWFVKPANYTPDFPSLQATDDGMLGYVEFTNGLASVVSRVAYRTQIGAPPISAEEEADAVLNMMTGLDKETCKARASSETRPVPASAAGREGATQRTSWISFSCGTTHSLSVVRTTYTGTRAGWGPNLSASEFWYAK